jgi:hypothetical protein
VEHQKRSKGYSEDKHLIGIVNNSKQEVSKRDIFITGGILAILGLVAFYEGQWIGGFFLLGLGVVFMASTNQEWAKQFFEFIFSIFKGLWKMLSRSD